MTVESLGKSLLAQFSGMDFVCITKPYINNETRAEVLIETINRTAEEDKVRPIVIDTIVDNNISNQITSSNCFRISVFDAFVSPLGKELGAKQTFAVGHAQQSQSESYMRRIDAIHYAMENDDGSRLGKYDEADIILIGVSRSGKTPTCIYLGLQFGIHAANYPLTEEDFEAEGIPKALQKHKHKLFGLTIEPKRLQGIRQERRPNSEYSNIKTCQHEVRWAEQLYKKFNIPYINSTQFSIEEISARILDAAGIERRIQS